MNRDLVLSRSRSSRRVRQLSATAIRVAAYECCGQSLDQTVAELMARHLTPTDAVERLRQQARIPRDRMNDAQLAVFRSYVVLKEAIERNAQPGTPTESSDRELLDKIRKIMDTVSQMAEQEDLLTQLAAQLEESGSRFRRFVRKADRLWRKQQSRLRAEIYDSGRCEKAIGELGALYTKAYRDALREAEVPPSVRRSNHAASSGSTGTG